MVEPIRHQFFMHHIQSENKMARKIGKQMGHDLYVHKDYAKDTNISHDVLHNAKEHLSKNHPNFEYTIIKHNKQTNNVSFLHSPDWDSEHEPHIHHSVLVKPSGETKYMGPKKDPQIYHQKWQFVGDDYKGFDVNRSKLRTTQYTNAIDHLKQTTGDQSISKKIGTKSYWDKEVVPHIKESKMKTFKDFINEINGFNPKDSTHWFDDSTKQNHQLGWKSRDKLINMPIHHFLSMAESGHDIDKEKTVSGLVKNGTKFSSHPFLQIDHSTDSEHVVVGHEGRHRARALQKMGYTHMPVLLKHGTIRWSEQDSKNNFDYKEKWPTKLKSEDGKKVIDFPVKQHYSHKDFTINEEIANATGTPTSDTGGVSMPPTAKPNKKDKVILFSKPTARKE